MTNIKADRIENVLKIEFDMMQTTQNIGGRASCQDDWQTFYIMRGSQYASWSDEMLEYWENFITNCRDEGRNMVTEKYNNDSEIINRISDYFGNPFSED